MKKRILYLAIIPLLIVACNDAASSETTSSKPISSSNIVNTSSEEIVSSQEEASSSLDISSREAESSQEQSSSKKEDPIPENHYRINFDSILLKNTNDEYIHIKYDMPDEYLSFAHASNVYKKELALSAFAFVSVAPIASKAADIYTHFGFDDLYFSGDYETEERVDTVRYVIGHKKVDNTNIINLSISGYQYKLPWKNNFNLGESGNHKGFQEGANKVLPGILTYLSKYNKGEERTILFVNGYSRSAGISSVLISTLVDNNTIKQDDVYAYLFETPRAIDSNNKTEYTSVFNIINSADIVTYVPPEQYGLKRIGTDVDLYKENASEILKEFNSELNIGVFTAYDNPENGFKDDPEFVNYIISYLLQPVDPETIEVPLKDISTRDNFNTYVADDVSYLVSFLFSLPDGVLAKAGEEIKAKELGELMGLLQEDGLYNFLKPILDEFSVSYEEETLKEKLNNLLYLLMQKSNLLLIAMSEQYRANMMRAVYFHTLEVVLPLLIAQ